MAPGKRLQSSAPLPVGHGRRPLLRRICLLLILTLFVSPALAEKKVALVVGVSNYQHAPKLANTINDARGMRDSLTKLGFTVVYGEDLNQHDLNRTIGKFAEAVEGANVAIAYFAGHGATFDGVPYVVPVDAEFSNLSDIPYQLVSVETYIEKLRRAKGMRIAILDACRDNAAEDELKQSARTRGLGDEPRGLGRVKDASGLIVAYSTQFHATAADGDAGNSPFTAAILRNIATPGLDVTDFFREVSREVISKTKGEQTPEISLSFFDKYYLGGEAQIAALSPPSRDQLLKESARAAEECSRRVPPLEIFSMLSGTKVPATSAGQVCEKAVAADPDNAALAAKLAQVYFLAKENDKAFGLATKAANAGSADAMFILGRLKSDEAAKTEGSARAAAAKEAFDWYERASNKGSELATLGMGLAYVFGLGVQKDEKRGAQIVTRLAVADNAAAMLLLSVGYSFGVGVPKDAKASFAWLNRAAEKRFPPAMDQLAFTLEKGDEANGVPNDPPQAASLYRRAAESGDIEGMINTGRFYELGVVVRKSALEAADWYQRAVAAGGPQTAVDIGARFESGTRGFPADALRAADFYQQASDAGELRAVVALASLYADQTKPLHDESKSTALYLQAASAGEVPSMIVLAGRYVKGIGAPRSRSAAETWFLKAADKGGLGTMRAIAMLYWKGSYYDSSSASVTDFPVDELRASEWYLRIVDKGRDPADRAALADLYAEKNSPIRNDSEANTWYRKAADLGDTDSMIKLGARLAKGVGSPANEPEARSWFDKAAVRGGAETMHLLGDLYGKGEVYLAGISVDDFPVDDARAVTWYKKSAENGSSDGMLAIAEAYHSGVGISRDEEQAAGWYRQAAEKGDIAGMTNLADRYLTGQGVLKDPSRAVEWYSKAAALNDTDATVKLGLLYEGGRGIKRDFPKACGLYRKLADGPSDDIGKYRLGLCYRDGNGVSRDREEAGRWFEKAAALGNEDAAKALVSLRKGR